MSPTKRQKLPSAAAKTSMTTQAHVDDDLLTVDIPGAEDLWKSLRPLHRNTNGTQTSPRIRPMISMESLDDDDDEAGDISDTLNLPDLENINNPLLSNVAEE